MQRGQIEFSGKLLTLYSVDTLIVGSGCAGLNAADSLFDFGHQDIALVTEGINMGTSRNTGSDKQTYYKLSLVSGESDSVSELAQTLFSGGGVNGDTALAEAACSVRSFMKLVNLGVPFPTNRYGEYVGYTTDHDNRKRATSAGPLTSKFMTECLEQSVRRKQIEILDETIVFKLLVEDGAVSGAAGFDKKKNEFVMFRCNNIVLATGGHCQIYKNTVYPPGQTGMTGMALEAGAEGANLQEWQYGIASVDFKWNLSGTYQQVMPRYISVDENGTKREFLPGYLKSVADSVNFVFLKGYQWPFDTEKICGSSVIDFIVYNETVNKNRTVYLDFTCEPIALLNGFGDLSQEAYTYLKNSDALIKTPIHRLLKMNRQAVELFYRNGIDLSREPLKITVAAQHTNGGLAVDENWETNIKGLYAVGEAAGTFGTYRPGGTALNAAQVGALRAAEHIAYAKETRDLKATEAYKQIAMEQGIDDFFRLTAANSGRGNAGFKKTYEALQAEMSRCASMIRNMIEMERLKEAVSSELCRFWQAAEGVSADDIPACLKYRDMLITQTAVLDAMIFSGKKMGSRGGALVLKDSKTFWSAADILHLAPKSSNAFCDKIIYTTYRQAGADSRMENVRPIPKSDNWFETVWNEFLERRGKNA